MRTQILAVLSYAGATLSLIVAACTPFVLLGAFSQAVARTGIHVDAIYSGGTIARTVMRSAWQIDIYRPVEPRALQDADPFVQIAFRPATALPRRFTDEVDLNGDGRPDIRVQLLISKDPSARPSGEVIAFNPMYRSFRMPGRMPGSEIRFSELIAQSNGAVLVRVPIQKHSVPR